MLKYKKKLAFRLALLEADYLDLTGSALSMFKVTAIAICSINYIEIQTKNTTF